MNRCAVTGCQHIADVITNHHTQTEHGLSLKQADKLYGQPKPVKQAANNKIYEWINSTPLVTKDSFQALQSVRLRK